MMTLKVRTEQVGPHVRVRFFAGPDDGHLALCGSLLMRPDQWRALRAQLKYGNQQTYAELIIWPEDVHAVLDATFADLERDHFGGAS